MPRAGASLMAGRVVSATGRGGAWTGEVDGGGTTIALVLDADVRGGGNELALRDGDVERRAQMGRVSDCLVLVRSNW